MTSIRNRWRATGLAALGAATVLVAGVGVATAAGGPPLILGHHNSATKTTVLADSKGSPLSLQAKHGKAPLLVNSSKLVKHLNAALVGGSSASALKTTGSAAATNYGYTVNSTVSSAVSTVAATGHLGAGTYYVDATAVVVVPSGQEVRCGLTTADPTTLTGNAMIYQSEAGATSTQSMAATLTAVMPVKVTKGQTIKEYCWITGSGKFAELDYAGITALHVDVSTAGTFPPGNPVG